MVFWERTIVVPERSGACPWYWSKFVSVMMAYTSQSAMKINDLARAFAISERDRGNVMVFRRINLIGFTFVVLIILSSVRICKIKWISVDLWVVLVVCYRWCTLYPVCLVFGFLAHNALHY